MKNFIVIGGNALVKLIIEALGLNLVRSFEQTVRLLECTLFYYRWEKPPDEKNQLVRRIADAALKFVQDGRFVLRRIGRFSTTVQV